MMNLSTLLYYISLLSGYGNQCRDPKNNYKDCRVGQLTRWFYTYIAAKMEQKTITSGKGAGAYWMLWAWFWQMLTETFAWGTNFSIQTCNYGKYNASMRSKLPHIWHSFWDSNNVSYLCLELMIFKDQTVCQGWGLPVSGKGLPKVSSKEDFLFNRISNILEPIVYSIKRPNVPKAYRKAGYNLGWNLVLGQ